MSEAGRPRFDRKALRSAAGDAAFAKGAAYAQEGRVRLQSISKDRLRAQVTGTTVYSVTLQGAGTRFTGACNCPAFDDWGFCKHIVAVALALDDAEPSALAEITGRTERLRTHLAGLDAQTLASRLFAVAERDPALWRELELEASVAGDDDETVLRRLCEALDAVLDVDEYVDWRGAGTLAAELREAVGQVEKVLASGRPRVALQALERLFDDYDELMEQVDDSDGEISGAFAEAQELHITACAAAQVDPVGLARELFDREADCGYTLWECAHDSYAEVLGPAGLAEFRCLADLAWRNETDDGGRRNLARRVLDDFAREAGDVDARIALRSSEAKSPWDYIQLATICLEAGRDDEALRWAEEGLWKTEDRPDARLITLAAHLHRRRGQTARADELLWAEFNRSPGQQLFQLLKDGATAPSEVVDRAVAVLERRIAEEGDRHWSVSADLTVDILTGEGRLDAAWAALAAYRCGERVIEALAQASEASHPDQSLQAYATLVERALAATSQAGYIAAVRLIARMERIRLNLSRQEEQAAYVQDLATRHKFKRNFIKLLNDRASWPKA